MKRPASSNLLPCFAASLLVASLPTMAFERDHEAHVHGHAELSIASEGHELIMELHSPAMNIVGFEHQPSNKEQRQAIEKAEQTFKQASTLFSINPEAHCHLEQITVKSALLAENEHHEDHHDEHDHDKHHKVHHDKHDHEKNDTHSEFTASYRYHCENIKQLSSMALQLFKQFPAIEELEVQIATDKGQQLLELNPQQSLIRF